MGGTRKRVAQHQFAQIPRAEIQRSHFNRSHTYKTTLNSGLLIPIYVDEMLPGDTFSSRMTLFGRLATPIFPLLDNIYLDTFTFFVPNRLVMDDWAKLNGEQKNPGDSTAVLVPQVLCPTGGWPIQSLADYFGIPTEVSGVNVNALHFRAYNLIYNEWFRDENLIDSLEVKTDSTDDNASLYSLQRRGKRHDYFTSCLPFAQKGDGVELPIGGSVRIKSTGEAFNLKAGAGTTGSAYLGLSTGSEGWPTGVNPSSHAHSIPSTLSVTGPALGETITGMSADILATGGLTINSFREAFQLQRLLERDARGGTRYTEIVRSHFGVVSPDARLQRPEYLGGSSVPITLHPVAQTAPSDSVSPQGSLAAFGVVASSRGHWTYSATEHGVLITLAAIRAELTYQQGLNRMWSRRTRFDFYWPSLAHLGEQPVLNKEIYAQGDPVFDDDVFGYQERYAEYRYSPSLITGKFRSTYAQSLDAWHLSQEFGSLPVLGKTFIEDNPPLERVVAVVDEPHLLLDVAHSLQCARPMPVYGVPGLIDHF